MTTIIHSRQYNSTAWFCLKIAQQPAWKNCEFVINFKHFIFNKQKICLSFWVSVKSLGLPVFRLEGGIVAAELFQTRVLITNITEKFIPCSLICCQSTVCVSLCVLWGVKLWLPHPGTVHPEGTVYFPSGNIIANKCSQPAHWNASLVQKGFTAPTRAVVPLSDMNLPVRKRRHQHVK